MNLCVNKEPVHSGNVKTDMGDCKTSNRYSITKDQFTQIDRQKGHDRIEQFLLNCGADFNVYNDS